MARSRKQIGSHGDDRAPGSGRARSAGASRAVDGSSRGSAQFADAGQSGQSGRANQPSYSRGASSQPRVTQGQQPQRSQQPQQVQLQSRQQQPRQQQGRQQQGRQQQSGQQQGYGAQPLQSHSSEARLQNRGAQFSSHGTEQSRQFQQSSGRGAQSGYTQQRRRQTPPPQAGKKKPKCRGLSKALLIVGLLLVFASLAVGGILARQYLSARSSYSSVVEAAAVDEETVDASTLQVDWDALREINPDVIGWVLIPGTIVNYPVVKTTDNNYYLEHLFNGAVSKAGAVFLDCDAQPDFSCRNSLIYGHNLIDGSMFASVTKYVDEDYFNKHHEVLLATPTCNYRLRPVCSLVWDGSDGSIRQANFESDEDFHSFVQSLLDRSAVKGDYAAEEVDQLICLVTCSYQTDNSRTVLCLKPVKTYDPNTGMEYLEDKPAPSEDQG